MDSRHAMMILVWILNVRSQVWRRILVWNLFLMLLVLQIPVLMFQGWIQVWIPFQNQDLDIHLPAEIEVQDHIHSVWDPVTCRCLLRFP